MESKLPQLNASADGGRKDEGDAFSPAYESGEEDDQEPDFLSGQEGNAPNDGRNSGANAKLPPRAKSKRKSQLT